MNIQLSLFLIYGKSLVSIIYNVFEFLIYGSLFPLTKNIIAPDQHDCFAGRSTITNLMFITQEIAVTIDTL